MAIIVNELETEEDIQKYKTWMSKKGTRHLQSICKMIKTDKKYRPDRWKNIDLRIRLLEEEIESRE